MEENAQPVSVRSAGVKFGLISGLIGILGFLVVSIMGNNPFQGVWNWIGVGLTIILLFLAQKNFKDSGDGFMTYGQGVGVGFWFTLVSTLLSILIMYLYVNFVNNQPMELFYEEQAMNMEQQGQSEQAIDVAMEWTRKLFWGIAIIGSLFWGMLIALILTIFTQKKRPETAF